jgi:hypothetical protein
MVDKVIATQAAWTCGFSENQIRPRADVSPVRWMLRQQRRNCFLPGEITMGAGDVYLGDIGGCPFYIGKSQYEYWKHTQLIIDVIEGTGGTFSLEGPEGKAFHTGLGCSRRRNWRNWQSVG